jgi:hypothetical protein
MSDHAWTQENLAAFVAGGLEAAEDERLERHAAECAECAAALRQARLLDRGLDSLFAAGRPGPALEDRMVQSLRTVSARELLRAGWRRKLAWGAAAAAVLGATGAGMSQFVGEGLPFPGASVALNSLRALKPKVYRESTTGTTDIKDENYSLVAEKKMLRDPEEMAEALRQGAMGADFHDGTSNKLVHADGSVRNTNPPAGNVFGFGDLAPEERREKAPGAGMGPPVTYSPDGRALRSDSRSNSETFAPRDARSSRRQPETSKPTQPPRGEDYYFRPGDDDKKKELADQEGKSNKGGEKESGRPGESQAPPTDNKGPDKTTPAPTQAKPAEPAPEPAAPRKVIRTGDIEFEIESFDSALATVTKLVTAIKGAFVATVNSDKLANGKVKGSVVVRVPPESLDTLVLDLRRDLGKGGELKGQRIGSQDITKQYTDLESRLKAARTMEQRLLQIIKEGKGEIKQLLEAEKELGNWRTKIEEFEGEIRYYANQVSLSTLTVTLTEKEIKTAADVVESERVSAGIEVEDVDKTMREALAAVTDAKGRVTKSELKQHSAGQYMADLCFEVAPDAAGPLRDRLKQLGNMVRLEINRVQQAEGGTMPPPRDAKVRRGDTRFEVSLYNLAKVAPRETATVQAAVTDVPAGYRTLREAVERAKGRIVTAELNEQDRQNVTAQLDFEVRRAEEPAIQAALAAAGEMLSRSVNRAPESQNVTDAKVLFKTTLISAASIKPRDTVTLGIEVTDVDATRALFAAQVAEVHGRTVDEQVGHERSGRVTGRLIYDVPLSAAPGLVEQFKKAGTVRMQQATRNPQAADGKMALARLDVTLSNAELIVPKDEGVWPQVRKGLSYSMYFLSLSVTWLIFGLCVVLPWALVGYGGYRVVRRLSRTPQPAAPAPAPPAA